MLDDEALSPNNFYQKINSTEPELHWSRKEQAGGNGFYGRPTYGRGKYANTQ